MRFKTARVLAAALALAAGTALTAPAFAAEPTPTGGQTAQQAQPNANSGAKHKTRTAKKKAHDAQTAAKPKTDKIPSRKPEISL